MNKNLLAIAVAAAAISVAGAASAVTVSGTVCEGGGPGVGTVPGGCTTTLGDFNTNVSTPTLELAGDTAIYGGVTHQSGSSSNWTDGWTIDFGTASYDAVFNWTNASSTAAFDGEFVVDGTIYVLGDNGTIDLGTLTGSVTFQVNPIAGSINSAENAFWNLQLAAVPVPAAGLLLLTALGGLGFARRRKAQAA